MRGASFTDLGVTHGSSVPSSAAVGPTSGSPVTSTSSKQCFPPLPFLSPSPQSKATAICCLADSTHPPPLSARLQSRHMSPCPLSWAQWWSCHYCRPSA